MSIEVQRCTATKASKIKTYLGKQLLNGEAPEGVYVRVETKTPYRYIVLGDRSADTRSIIHAGIDSEFIRAGHPIPTTHYRLCENARIVFELHDD